MENKIVAHTRDGRVVKGMTHDFNPQQDSFHVLPAEGGGIPLRLSISELKALFYVKDYFGNREYKAPHSFGAGAGLGPRCVVTFFDGETIFGTTPDYEASAVGFTLYPSDPDDNNDRLFVAKSAVREIVFP